MFENVVEMSFHSIIGPVDFLAQVRKTFVEDAFADVTLDMFRDGTSAQHVWLDDLDFLDDFRIKNPDRAWRCRFRSLGLRRPDLRLLWPLLLLLGAALSGSPQEFFNVAGHVVAYL